MRVLFIPPGTIQTASARLRAYWVAECMEDAEVIPYNEVEQADIDRADVVIWGKRIMSFEKHEGQKLFWDICDPVHWFNDQQMIRYWADMMDGIVTSNDGLTGDFNHWYGQDIAVTIEDRLRMASYPLKRDHAHADPVRLIWFGNYGNRWCLQQAIGDLLRLTYCGVHAELTICDDKPEDNWLSYELPIYMVRWSLDTENKIISSHDIAILPRMAGHNGDVKSYNKTLTAWANCLPVYQSEDSFDWLMRLCTESDLRQQVGFRGLETVEAAFKVEKSAKEWMELIG